MKEEEEFASSVEGGNKDAHLSRKQRVTGKNATHRLWLCGDAPWLTRF